MTKIKDLIKQLQKIEQTDPEAIIVVPNYFYGYDDVRTVVPVLLSRGLDRRYPGLPEGNHSEQIPEDEAHKYTNLTTCYTLR